MKLKYCGTERNGRIKYVYLFKFIAIQYDKNKKKFRKCEKYKFKVGIAEINILNKCQNVLITTIHVSKVM